MSDIHKVNAELDLAPVLSLGLRKSHHRTCQGQPPPTWGPWAPKSCLSWPCGDGLLPSFASILLDFSLQIHLWNYLFLSILPATIKEARVSQEHDRNYPSSLLSSIYLPFYRQNYILRKCRSGYSTCI